MVFVERSASIFSHFEFVGNYPTKYEIEALEMLKAPLPRTERSIFAKNERDATGRSTRPDRYFIVAAE